MPKAAVRHAPKRKPAAHPRPTAATVLVVLDGWGVGEANAHNAIHMARTPNWDALWQGPAKTLLDASGTSVGLPVGQMGNSEVGHMNLGAGRVVHQDLTRIDHAIECGDFDANPVLNDTIGACRGQAALHVLGLLSPGGVHSHEQHIAALLALAARRGATVRLHAFLDGRDTPPRSALRSLRMIDARFPGVIATIAGRYYAMDRDLRWQRTERAYKLIQGGEASFHFDTPQAALEAAYGRGESDEFVQPTAIHPADESPARLADGDAAVFMNFRADRARQLARAIVADEFPGFDRGSRPRLAAFATLTPYADEIDAPVAFGAEPEKHTLGECLTARGLTQLRIAETEKYAHVTYFFSGGRERPFPGEERILVSSPRVATYDLTPAMSAQEVTDHLVDAVASRRHDVIVCNYANADMVGHTGKLNAAVQAVESVDECLGRLLDAVAESGAQCLVTADHGNVERMVDGDCSTPHTAHTAGPVPLVYAGPRQVRFRHGGTLADVAPTLLALMDIKAPPAMTGRSLLANARCA